MFNLKQLARPYYKDSTGAFEIWENSDLGLENLPDTYVHEVVVTAGSTNVCRIQQGVGHCCGASYLTNLQQVAPYFQQLVDFLTSKKQTKADYMFKWLLQDKLFFYLSDETVGWDEPIRTHKQVKHLFKFNNKATKPYSGSDVSLYVLEL